MPYSLLAISKNAFIFKRLIFHCSFFRTAIFDTMSLFSSLCPYPLHQIADTWSDYGLGSSSSERSSSNGHLSHEVIPRALKVFTNLTVLKIEIKEQFGC